MRFLSNQIQYKKKISQKFRNLIFIIMSYFILNFEARLSKPHSSRKLKKVGSITQNHENKVITVSLL